MLSKIRWLHKGPSINYVNKIGEGEVQKSLTILDKGEGRA